MGEFSPVPSPDGTSFAFISNRAGPMALYVAPAAEDRPHPGVASRFPPARRVPRGRVQGRVVGPDGRPVAGRIQLVAADGRSYAPDDGFARVIAVSETHYFHSSGEFDVQVPAGRVALEAMRGFEFTPATATADVKAGRDDARHARGQPARDLPSLGWYSGDTHAHDLHQGRFGLTHRTLFDQSLGEDLHVTNVLIHMDGTRLMGRWADLTGEPSPLSTPTHWLQFSEEFRGSLGHIGMLGLSRYILPLTGGVNNTPYEQVASDTPYLDGARAQGGIAGFMHPYTNSSPNPAGWAGSLIPVDVALGKGEFYDVVEPVTPTSGRRRRCTTGCSTAGFASRPRAAPTTFPTSGAIRRRAPTGRIARVTGRLTIPRGSPRSRPGGRSARRVRWFCSR